MPQIPEDAKFLELQVMNNIKKIKDGYNFNNIDYSNKNEEIDIDSLDTEMIIKLKYTEEEYNLVKDQLSKIASTPEQAVWKLLGNE